MTASEVSKNEKIRHERDQVAAMQSIIPGLGHIYKGYFWKGIGLFLIAPATIWAGLIAAWATLGFSILFPIVYWVFVVYDAYTTEDRRKSHVGIL